MKTRTTNRDRYTAAGFQPLGSDETSLYRPHRSGTWTVMKYRGTGWTAEFHFGRRPGRPGTLHISGGGQFPSLAAALAFVSRNPVQ